jgi:ppGpp synthetase/RelA/SpoT-type nucleotidyltranferase
MSRQPAIRIALYNHKGGVGKPRSDAFVTCEIQVRTLFEEAWGEIEHRVNYPNAAKSKVVRDQIGVLARLVGAGTRLADSIFEADESHKKASQKAVKAVPVRKKTTAKVTAPAKQHAKPKAVPLKTKKK